jgi:predicted transcriptional regulator
MYDSYIMKRTQIYLENEQDRKLGKRASATGVTKSTLIRQAIDAYLDARTDDAARLARFRAALNDVAVSPASLPDGRSYVEALRSADVRRQDEIDRRRR